MAPARAEPGCLQWEQAWVAETGIDSEGALEVQRRVGWARAGVSEALVCGGEGGSLGACRRWEGSCGGEWDGVQSRRCFFLEKKNLFLHGADGGSACHSFYSFG